MRAGNVRISQSINVCVVSYCSEGDRHINACSIVRKCYSTACSNREEGITVIEDIWGSFAEVMYK